LAVDVTTDCYGACYFRDVLFFVEDCFSLRSEAKRSEAKRSEVEMGVNDVWWEWGGGVRCEFD
jgi:hypothetical protein